MPSNKTSLYDGVVLLDDNALSGQDSLDLTGHLSNSGGTFPSIAAYIDDGNNSRIELSLGTTHHQGILLTADPVLKPGRAIWNLTKNNLVGVIRKDSNASAVSGRIYLKKRNHFDVGDYISLYPKYEIVKIQSMSSGVIIAQEAIGAVGCLIPVNYKYPGTAKTDVTALYSPARWGSQAVFGTSGDQGNDISEMTSMMAGSTIEGRFQHIIIDTATGSMPDESIGCKVLCYLKAKPVVM
jgi:hypothetical protein